MKTLNSGMSAYSHQRRRFLMTVSVAGSAVGVTVLMPALSLQASQAVPVTSALNAGSTGSTGMDEALGNSPGYSANIGYGRGAVHFHNDESIADPQLMV